jgi:hypothetical protein
MDNVEKRKFLALPGLELRPLGHPALTCSYTDCAIPAEEKEPSYIFGIFYVVRYSILMVEVCTESRVFLIHAIYANSHTIVLAL